MRSLGRVNRWGLVAFMFLTGALAVGALTACDSEDATAVSAPAAQPQSTNTAPPAPTIAQETTVYVGPVWVDCEGEGPQKCMLTKENPNEKYSLFYDQIEGFEFEEGYEYELLVKTEPVENPPAGGSSIKWTLVEVVDKSMSLEGRMWQLGSYVSSSGEVVDTLHGTTITIEFRDGQLDGKAGCNNYFGAYVVDANSLTVGAVGMTEMYCDAPEGVMDQESAYLMALQSAARYQITDDQLQIANADGETILTYAIVEPTLLSGTHWQLNGYNNGKGGFSSVLAGTEITADFSDDGVVGGLAGCNTYTAAYEVDGDNITIGPAATTRKMCPEPEGIMEQEAQYLAALETAATYQVQGDNLEMRTEDGAKVASYSSLKNASVASELMTALRNMPYKIETTESGEATLIDGEYREKAAPDSATETAVLLTENVAYGTLGNGEPAAAVILVSDPGGSGTFYYLALVDLQGGEPVNVATTLLGDRVIIKSLAIQEGQLAVELVTHGSADPLCCPTQQVLQTFELQGEELVQISSEMLSADEVGGEIGSDLIGIVWKWEQLTTPADSITVAEPDRYTVEFQPDGQVSVQADCNAGNGAYTLDHNSLSIEIMALTAAACPPDSLSDEFVKNLNAAAIYFRDGEELFIDLQFDSGTMRFAQ